MDISRRVANEPFFFLSSSILEVLPRLSRDGIAARCSLLRLLPPDPWLEDKLQPYLIDTLTQTRTNWQCGWDDGFALASVFWKYRNLNALEPLGDLMEQHVNSYALILGFAEGLMGTDRSLHYERVCFEMRRQTYGRFSKYVLGINVGHIETRGGQDNCTRGLCELPPFYSEDSITIVDFAPSDNMGRFFQRLEKHGWTAEASALAAKLAADVGDLNQPELEGFLMPMLRGILVLLGHESPRLRDPGYQALFQKATRLYLDKFVGLANPGLFKQTWVPQQCCWGCKKLFEFLDDPSAFEGTFLFRSGVPHAAWLCVERYSEYTWRQAGMTPSSSHCEIEVSKKPRWYQRLRRARLQLDRLDSQKLRLLLGEECFGEVQSRLEESYEETQALPRMRGDGWYKSWGHIENVLRGIYLDQQVCLGGAGHVIEAVASRQLY